MSLIPEITPSEFWKRIDLRERRIPIDGAVETTYRCNLRCAHCYVNEAAGDREIQSRELPLERLKRLIDEIVEQGCLFLLLTGGEVLLRPDFPDLYVHAVKKGLRVTLFTNGTLITDRIADLLDEYRPETVEISLYGMTRETYEKVTRIPGSYDKCLAGIRRLVERKIPLKLKTMALTWNYHEVQAMEAYAQSLGVPFRFDTSLNARVDCGANRNGELQLSADQAIELDLMNPVRLAELKAFCEKFVSPQTEAPREQVYNCGAGLTTFTVDPYGQLQMCQLSRRKSVDLKLGSFSQGWHEVLPQFRMRRWQSNSVCRRCSLISLCGSCPGASELESGDVETLIPEFCEIAHKRAAAVMGEASGHRSDATCCLGGGQGVARPLVPEPSECGAGCGSCGSASSRAPAPLQVQRRRTQSTAS